MESGRRRRMYSSWLPIDRARIRLLIRIRDVKNTKSYNAQHGHIHARFGLSSSQKYQPRRQGGLGRLAACMALTRWVGWSAGQGQVGHHVKFGNRTNDLRR